MHLSRTLFLSCCVLTLLFAGYLAFVSKHLTVIGEYPLADDVADDTLVTNAPITTAMHQQHQQQQQSQQTPPSSVRETTLVDKHLPTVPTVRNNEPQKEEVTAEKEEKEPIVHSGGGGGSGIPTATTAATSTTTSNNNENNSGKQWKRQNPKNKHKSRVRFTHWRKQEQEKKSYCLLPPLRLNSHFFHSTPNKRQKLQQLANDPNSRYHRITVYLNELSVDETKHVLEFLSALVHKRYNRVTVLYQSSFSPTTTSSTASTTASNVDENANEKTDANTNTIDNNRDNNNGNNKSSYRSSKDNRDNELKKQMLDSLIEYGSHYGLITQLQSSSTNNENRNDINKQKQQGDDGNNVDEDDDNEDDAAGDDGSDTESSPSLSDNTRQSNNEDLSRIVLKFEFFTGIVLGYNPDRMKNNLHQVFSQYLQHPALHQIHFIWNNVNEAMSYRDLTHELSSSLSVSGSKRSSSQSSSHLLDKIQVRLANKNSLNNRFIPRKDIETNAIFVFDDDHILSLDQLTHLFKTWKRHRSRLVGLVARKFSRDYRYTFDWSHRKNNLVLPIKCFFDRRYLDEYWSWRFEDLRNYVNSQQAHCDDIALNFLIYSMSRRPHVLVQNNGPVSMKVRKGAISSQVGRVALRTECAKWIAKFFRNRVPPPLKVIKRK